MFNAKSREEIAQFLKSDNHRSYIIEAATGSGKTYCSILKSGLWNSDGGHILVVIPKKNLKTDWIREFNKFGYERLLDKVTFICYNSLQKHVETHWNTVIFDEIHHLSDRCKEILKVMKYDHLIGLSATLKREIRTFLYLNVRGIETVRLTLKTAIDNGVVPNPKIILIPMSLDDKVISEVYVKNPKASKSVEVSYCKNMIFRDKTYRYNIHCTQQQKYLLMTEMIQWLKSKPELKNAWLHKCGERLKWLSDIKTDFVKEILRHLSRRRTITFCNSIEQSNKLGKNSVNSKNGVAQDVIDAFNDRKIDRVTCVEMMTEGCNLTDCKIGIFAMINGESRLQIQKTGRVLRHEKPVIIIPYYINTRDEEIVNRMTQNYDTNMVIQINNLSELKEHLK